MRRCDPYFSSLEQGDFILDIGAGRQIFENEYAKYREKNKSEPLNCRIITFDLADIKNDQLFTNHPHIQADGTNLPFADGSIAGAVSNMALDFIPKEAIGELNRVLKQGASVFLNLHHEHLIPLYLDYDLNRLLKKIQDKNKFKGRIPEKWLQDFAVLNHRKYLRDNNILYKSEKQIREIFGQNDFKVLRATEATDGKDKWWEVDLVKLSKSQKAA